MRALRTCAPAPARQLSRPTSPHSKLLERILKKNKTAGVKPFQVKSHLWVFVNALIENPAFDSQARPHPRAMLLLLLRVTMQPAPARLLLTWLLRCCHRSLARCAARRKRR